MPPSSSLHKAGWFSPGIQNSASGIICNLPDPQEELTPSLCREPSFSGEQRVPQNTILVRRKSLQLFLPLTQVRRQPPHSDSPVSRFLLFPGYEQNCWFKIRPRALATCYKILGLGPGLSWGLLVTHVPGTQFGLHQEVCSELGVRVLMTPLAGFF